MSTSRFMPFAVGGEVVQSSSWRAEVASGAPVATDPSSVGAFWQVEAVSKAAGVRGVSPDSFASLENSSLT